MSAPIFEAPKLFAKTEKPARPAPIFEAEASISMPTRFIVPAEFSMSIPLPKSAPAAPEEETEDVEKPKLFAKSEKTARRTLTARRHLMESMSMSAPIFEAEASISMPTRFIVPAEFSMSMPLPKSAPAAPEEEAEDVEKPRLFAKTEKPARRTLADRRHLMESMSMSAPIFEAEASISMPTRFIVPAEFSMSMPLPKSAPAPPEEEAEDVEKPKLFAKSEKPARRTL
jgi:hypothetical protein